MEEKIKDFFEELSEEKALRRIQREVKETSKEVVVKRKGIEVKEMKRGRSQYVLDQLHSILDAKHKLDCKNAEGPCLLELVKEYMPKRIGKDVIDALALIIPALYPKRNTQSQWFTNFSGAIQEKFPT